jgi:hypothetical protein
VKGRGVAVAMLSGSRWAPPSSIDSVVNVGTIRGRPPSGYPVRRWAGPLPTEGRRVGRRPRCDTRSHVVSEHTDGGSTMTKV